MSNPMKYIRDLEAAGFERQQAEAQVQMVLDALEGDLVTKAEFAVFREHLDKKFIEVDHRFVEMDQKFIAKFDDIGHRFEKLQLTMTVRMGVMFATGLSITIAVLGWLIKLH
jgi:hypothetical protein